MNKEQQEKLIKAFITEKFLNAQEKGYSESVKRIQNHLFQMGVWEESKEILKEFLLTYFGFLGDVETEFSNGELRRKR
jgi:hypothetical protein